MDFSQIGVKQLAELADLPEQFLADLLSFIPKLYYSRRIEKKSGGLRTLEIPYDELKDLQRKLLKRLLNQIPAHPAVFGYSGSSIKHALVGHTKKPIVITLDIADFFPSVRRHMVVGCFKKAGFTEVTAQVLTRIVTHKNHIPQGAPTSPCIGRLAISPFANQLERMLSKIDGKTHFSIYVDDIIISGPKGLKKAIGTICSILEENGFKAKYTKIAVMESTKEQVALGVQLNKKIIASNKFLQELEVLSRTLPPEHPVLQGKGAWAKFLEKSDMGK